MRKPTVAAGFLAIVWVTATSARELPDPKRYFCALHDVTATALGQFAGTPDYSSLRRPDLSVFPHPEDESFLYQRVTEDGRYYYYAREVENDDSTPYVIHGVFDFQEKQLATSRSGIFRASDGELKPEGSSYLFLCSDAE